LIIPDYMIKQLCKGFVPFAIMEYYENIGYGMGKCLNKPMVTPFDPELVNPASLDIRVGNTAKLRHSWGYIPIDLSEYSEQNPCILMPGERVLIDSLETFNLPNFICAQFRLKSSRGREWYEHMEAGFCDPGWHGSKLTMEIINMDLNPLPLYTGLRMGQLIFSLMLAIPEKDYSVTGRYNNDKTVMESKG
jgi:dCTP deaminase